MQSDFSLAYPPPINGIKKSLGFKLRFSKSKDIPYVKRTAPVEDACANLSNYPRDGDQLVGINGISMVGKTKKEVHTIFRTSHANNETIQLFFLRHEDNKIPEPEQPNPSGKSTGTPDTNNNSNKSETVHDVVVQNVKATGSAISSLQSSRSASPLSNNDKTSEASSFSSSSSSSSSTSATEKEAAGANNQAVKLTASSQNVATKFHENSNDVVSLCNGDEDDAVQEVEVASSSSSSSSKKREKISYTGVYLANAHRNKRAECRIFSYISVKSCNIQLGYFETEKDAAIAWDKAAIKYRGRETKTNFPISNYTTYLVELDAKKNRAKINAAKNAAKKAAKNTKATKSKKRARQQNVSSSSSSSSTSQNVHKFSIGGRVRHKQKTHKLYTIRSLLPFLHYELILDDYPSKPYDKAEDELEALDADAPSRKRRQVISFAPPQLKTEPSIPVKINKPVPPVMKKTEPKTEPPPSSKSMFWNITGSISRKENATRLFVKFKCKKGARDVNRKFPFSCGIVTSALQKQGQKGPCTIQYGKLPAFNFDRPSTGMHQEKVATWLEKLDKEIEKRQASPQPTKASTTSSTSSSSSSSSSTTSFKSTASSSTTSSTSSSSTSSTTTTTTTTTTQKSYHPKGTRQPFDEKKSTWSTKMPSVLSDYLNSKGVTLTTSLKNVWKSHNYRHQRHATGGFRYQDATGILWNAGLCSPSKLTPEYVVDDLKLHLPSPKEQKRQQKLKRKREEQTKQQKKSQKVKEKKQKNKVKKEKLKEKEKIKKEKKRKRLQIEAERIKKKKDTKKESTSSTSSSSSSSTSSTSSSSSSSSLPLHSVKPTATSPAIPEMEPFGRIRSKEIERLKKDQHFSNVDVFDPDKTGYVQN